jgi:preprotein translocase subunit SecF
MIPGLIGLAIWKLPLGIDFKGGAEFEIQLSQTTSINQLRTKLDGYSQIKGLSVSQVGENDFLIKTLPISNDDHSAISDQLKKDFGSVTEKSFQLVGPSVSRDLTIKAIEAVVLASLLIILYLAYSFRGVNQPVSSWRFGMIAVVALLHDLLISIGVFSILAHFLHFEVDASIITALLTIMGFSVHDTIVVFDRVRENLLRHKLDVGGDFEATVDASLSQTLNRSLATSLTVIFTLAALVLLGGSSIRPFVVTLLIGITIGTYSSIFTASPLLVVWQKRAGK